MTRGLYIAADEYVSFAEAQRRLSAGNKSALSGHVATRERSPDFIARGLWLPNPDPILKKMGKDIEFYRGLRSDAHTGGCIRRRKAAIKALEWKIERGRASARVTRIVQAVFDALDMDALLNQILDAVLYGYQPLEIIWQSRAGQAPLPAQIIGKPPEWFLFDAEARLRFRSRGQGLQGELTEPRKFLLARQEATYANPYGFADLSMCFWPVTFKRGGLRYWVKFSEKYGMPWAVGKQPRNTPQPETGKLLDQLEAMIEDAVAVIPDDASVEMLQAPGASGNADAYRELLMFCRSEVAIALLGQNQSTESDSTHASAMAALGVTSELRDGDRRLVEGVLNTQLIRWIVDLHEGEEAPAPQFALWEEEEVSTALAERDEILARTGVRFTRSYFRRAYAFQEDDIELSAPEMPGVRFAEGRPDVAARLVETLGPAAQTVVDGWLDRIEAMVAEADDLAALQERLLAAFAELPDAALVELMASALAAARAAGMDDARPR